MAQKKKEIELFFRCRSYLVGLGRTEASDRRGGQSRCFVRLSGELERFAERASDESDKAIE